MNGFDLSTISNLYVGGTQASAIYLGSNKIWPAAHDYSRDPFTIEFLDTDVLRVMPILGGAQYEGNCYISYSLDDGSTWVTASYPNDTPVDISLSAGHKAMFKSEAIRTDNVYWSPLVFDMINDGRFNVMGNLHSLIYGDNFIGNNNLPTGFFCDLFYRNDQVLPYSACNVIDASNLILPALSLTPYCYRSMFRYCDSLIAAPQLPATTLADNCYWRMFSGCTSLTTAPELSASTLADNCYWQMFSGCASLNYVKCLATDISALYPTGNWLNDVAATGTFVKAASMNSWTTGTDGIPSGWTVQNAS